MQEGINRVLHKVECGFWAFKKSHAQHLLLSWWLCAANSLQYPATFVQGAEKQDADVHRLQKAEKARRVFTDLCSAESILLAHSSGVSSSLCLGAGPFATPCSRLDPLK